MHYARKDFELEQVFQEEVRILKEILNQTKKHDNILVALAGLQYGNTFSLFFPLASCDLWKYLSGDYMKNIFPPSNWEEKIAIYRREVRLAEALAFLHYEFRNKRLEVLSCYHLDLKLHNILVFNAYTESETWKITDFNLSRVKGRGIDGREDVWLVMAFLGNKRITHLREPSTLNRRGEGTYTAPECDSPQGKVNSSSDIWPFGCILSDVMSYIDSGPSGVLEFGRQRRQQRRGNAFYINEGRKYTLSPEVMNWFARLRQRAQASHSTRESYVVCETIDFLQKSVLNPLRDKRVSAKDVEVKLTAISQPPTGYQIMTAVDA